MSEERHHILLAVLVFALGFVALVSDTALNRPRGSASSGTGPVLINTDPAYSIHHWTVPGPGGDYGLVGFSQTCYRPRSTGIRFGPRSTYVDFSIYSVAGFFVCVFAALGIFTAGFAARAR